MVQPGLLHLPVLLVYKEIAEISERLDRLVYKVILVSPAYKETRAYQEAPEHKEAPEPKEPPELKEPPEYKEPEVPPVLSDQAVQAVPPVQPGQADRVVL